jgi:hypothetical protein
MSAAKRDNCEFRRPAAAIPAASRSMPRNGARRPDQTSQALGLQASWNEATRPGSDPYNSRGARTRP